MILQNRFDKLLKNTIDGIAFALAYCLAFIIRFEGDIANEPLGMLKASILYVLLLKLVCCVLFNVQNLTWRHVSIMEARRIAMALTVASGILACVRLFPRSFPIALIESSSGVLPFGVILIDWFLSLLLLLGARVGVRLWLAPRSSSIINPNRQRTVPTILIGAGHAGALVANELHARRNLGIKPIGFLDDDPTRRGMVIHGIPVLGSPGDIEYVSKVHGAEQALITLDHANGTAIRRLVTLCRQCNVQAKIIPGIEDAVAGKPNLSTIRDVAIEDLLHREPVQLDCQAITAIVKARRVMITGAGGSIGSELCREICRFGPAGLILLDHAENNLFAIHHQLSHDFPRLSLVPCIADVRDSNRLAQVFEAWRPDVVFHAAAHKHVPLMEWNPVEALKTNVFGTRNLADCADRAGVSEVVMISTDKAVKPSSMMGVSKRLAELYVQALGQKSSTRFVTVRFGNVLGSNGSVIPIFKEQISRGCPITVTHPEMRRYFMTIPEACQLVLQAASMGQGGEIFILDMGEPVKIVDLAQDLIRLSGLSSDEVEIQFTGIRPGEKLFEELSMRDEDVQKTAHPKVFIGRLVPRDYAEICEHFDELLDLLDDGDLPALVRKLEKIVPEFQPSRDLLHDRDSTVPRYRRLNGRPKELNGTANGRPHSEGLVGKTVASTSGNGIGSDS